MYDLALTLTTALNFTMELEATDMYGEELPNGSWAGVVGMLQRREADITVNDFSITQSRSKVGERGGMKNLGLCGVCVCTVFIQHLVCTYQYKYDSSRTLSIDFKYMSRKNKSCLK